MFPFILFFYFFAFLPCPSFLLLKFLFHIYSLPFLPFNFVLYFLLVSIRILGSTSLFFSSSELDVSGNCSSRSRSALQWDALVLFGDGVLTSLQAASQRTKEEEGSGGGLSLAQRYPDGVRLLSVLLESSTRDPLILTSQISLLTDLLPFAEGQPALITAVLQKVRTTYRKSYSKQANGARKSLYLKYSLRFIQALINSQRRSQLCTILIHSGDE